MNACSYCQFKSYNGLFCKCYDKLLEERDKEGHIRFFDIPQIVDFNCSHALPISGKGHLYYYKYNGDPYTIPTNKVWKKVFR